MWKKYVCYASYYLKELCVCLSFPSLAPQLKDKTKNFIFKCLSVGGVRGQEKMEVTGKEATFSKHAFLYLCLWNHLKVSYNIIKQN